jgi:hypothetical protein
MDHAVVGERVQFPGGALTRTHQPGTLFPIGPHTMHMLIHGSPLGETQFTYSFMALRWTKYNQQ